ncbi:trypsin-like serine peptidase [Saccharothrix sp. NRRL B-16314]|uniref:trypsin-like serine peptidase n=1 Tax=Saccharothrix sp. NRRL B-16314 TaxID=1463825 RepID=UPI000A4F49D5|nr:serine protease [Saccharothrix sp. NRRL B-16314]
MPRPVITEALRLTDSLDELAAYVRDNGKELLATAIHTRAIAGPKVDLDAPEFKRQDDMVEQGLRALEKLRVAGGHADLTEVEADGLEAIVNLALRPALLMRDGDFQPPKVPWLGLTTYRRPIMQASRRVGRIQWAHPLPGGLPYLGTGFLVGEDVLMTNGHVAKLMCEPNGHYRPRTSTVDFSDDPDAGGSNRVDVVELVGVHPGYPPRPDLALFKVDRDSPYFADGVGHFAVRSDPPEPLMGSVVYTMGYPAYDTRNRAHAMHQVFGDIYNVKRLQPGGVMSYEEGTFYHDCSTLGGNSGSCVVDLESNQVVGLHFGGAYLERNYAVALWTLHDDPLLAKAGVEFD